MSKPSGLFNYYNFSVQLYDYFREKITSDLRKGKERRDQIKTVEEPGAHVLPFWIDMGTLGISVLSPAHRRTTILSLAINGSSEKTLYQADVLGPPIVPTISPSGRYLAFYQRRAPSPIDGPSDLILFDLDTQESRALIPSERILGSLRFGEESIFISGSTSALSLWLLDLNDRRLPSPTF